jgi:hypothetical protein
VSWFGGVTAGTAAAATVAAPAIFTKFDISTSSARLPFVAIGSSMSRTAAISGDDRRSERKAVTTDGAKLGGALSVVLRGAKKR